MFPVSLLSLSSVLLAICSCNKTSIFSSLTLTTFISSLTNFFHSQPSVILYHYTCHVFCWLDTDIATTHFFSSLLHRLSHRYTLTIFSHTYLSFTLPSIVISLSSILLGGYDLYPNKLIFFSLLQILILSPSSSCYIIKRQYFSKLHFSNSD